MSKALVNLSKDIKEICEPHFKRLGLDHLNYIHRDNDGNVTYLCSNQKWIDHYLKKSYPKIGAFEKNIELSQYNYILWTGLDRNDPILIDSKEMLDVEYGITLYDGSWSEWGAETLYPGEANLLERPVVTSLDQ